jgi:hypothetical protein
MTDAPADASRRAIALPCPRAAPVTRATRPASSWVSGCSVLNGNVSSFQTRGYTCSLSPDPLAIDKVIDIDVSTVCIVGAEGGQGDVAEPKATTGRAEGR